MSEGWFQKYPTECRKVNFIKYPTKCRKVWASVNDYEYETGKFQLSKNAKEGMVYGGCNCGNCHITISSNGDIMACRRVTNSKVANIFEDRLANVWVCQMEQYRDYEKFSKCSKCELKAWCRGCPAVANGTNGDFYSADPQCWKTKNDITGEELPC